MRSLRCAVIGGGMAGILAAIRLREAGFHDIVVYEKADSYGGTWRENTYPGIACDVPSHLYSYSSEPNPEWSHRFSPGQEIRQYLEGVARRHRLEAITRFGEEVASCRFLNGRWELETAGGIHDTADVVIAATGVLHHPNLPDIPGLESFRGAAFHSARWDHSVAIDGRRLGVVGTGSTAVQITGAVVDRVEHLSLFQRTAQWIMPQQNPAYNEEQKHEFRHNREAVARKRKEYSDIFTGAFANSLVDAESAEMRVLEDVCRANLEDNVKDPVLREKLRPTYRAACKRLVLSPNFYDAIQKPNADLVVERIERIEPAGIRTADGTLHELDVLVLATGFRVDRFVRPVKVLGTGDADLDDLWADGPVAYLSVAIPGFPNFFMLKGPNGPVGNFSLIDVAEAQMSYVIRLIDVARDARRAISPTAEATAKFGSGTHRGRQVHDLDDRVPQLVSRPARHPGHLAVVLRPIPGRHGGPGPRALRADRLTGWRADRLTSPHGCRKPHRRAGGASERPWAGALLDSMDVLVVVDEAPVPARLEARSRRRVDVTSGEVPSATIGDLRAHIPRSVGVIGGDSPDDAGHVAAVAAQLHHAGLPVIVYSDQPVTVESGIEVERITDPGPPMQVVDSLLDLVGNTPLVRLDRIARDIAPQLLAKLEFLNPGGSVKDRPAITMIEAAERDGSLTKGSTIVEPTSGNTGVGLAIVAARRGYRCIFTMPDKIASEKVALLRAYGAEVVVCPTAVDPEHPDSYYSVARRLVESTPGAFMPNQYANMHNPEAHEASTGPEIWTQTAGRVTHVVASIGTGGTITGIGRYLKAQNPAIQIIGADPEGSVYSGGSGRPYLVEGIGEDFWPETYGREVADRVVMVSDRESFLTARRLSREEGILVGGSSGTAVWAALEVGRGLGPDAVIVVIVPDSGRGYLSKLYDDSWMADHGFLRASGTAGDTVGDLLLAKSRGDRTSTIPPLVHVHPAETVRAAISILREYGVSQLPVVKAEPPLSLAEVVGTVSDRDLLDRVVSQPDALDLPVETVMGAPLPMIGYGEPLDIASDRLAHSSAVLVLDNGHPTGIVTRSDLLDFLSGPAPR